MRFNITNTAAIKVAEQLGFSRTLLIQVLDNVDVYFATSRTTAEKLDAAGNPSDGFKLSGNVSPLIIPDFFGTLWAYTTSGAAVRVQVDSVKTVHNPILDAIVKIGRKFGVTLALLLALAFPLKAQWGVNPPDCILTLSTQSAQRSYTFDNRYNACTTWQLVYTNDGFSAVSVELDEAPASSGAPGTWVIWPAANIPSGSLPLTATTSGQLTLYKFFPFVSINITSVTGTGTVKAVAFGYAPRGTNVDINSIGTSTTGCQFNSTLPTLSSGQSNPVQCDNAARLFVSLSQIAGGNTVNGGVAGSLGVGGLAGSGAAAAGNPILVGGSDGTNARTLTAPPRGTGPTPLASFPVTMVGGLDSNNLGEPFHMDSASGDGRTPSSALAAQANLYLFNGTNQDRGRSAGIGNNVGSTGLTADSPYGQFNTTLPTLTSGNYGALQVDSNGRLLVVPISVDPCQSPNTLKLSIPVNITSSGATQLIAAVTGKAIFVCGGFISVNSSATSPSTIQFQYGTGANCITGNTNLTGTMGTETATAGLQAEPVSLNSGATQFATLLSNALCIAASGTTINDQGYITYVQQ